MGGLRKGIVSIALAGAVATGGFIGGLMLSGTPATAATGGATTSLTATTVAATPSPSATPRSKSTTRHTCPHSSGTPSVTDTSSNNV